MQVKVLIGTGGVVLVMLLLGFVILAETGRMKAFAAAIDGRALERGALLYDTYCAQCHGENGTATTCSDANGNRIECLGLPLNSYFLLCGEPPRRLAEQGFIGTTAQYIAQITVSGNSTLEMPAFSRELGGPLDKKQVQDMTMFALNWADCERPVEVLFAPVTVEDFLALETEYLKIVPGDAHSGQQVYSTYGCNACHGSLDEIGSSTVGPWLGNLKEISGTRVEGISAAQYVYESILDPNAFIVPDCPFGSCTRPSLMPGTFGSSFMVRNPQDLADLLVYLLGEENLPGTP